MASSYIPQSGMTPDEVKQNRGLGQYLMRQNSGSEPLGHWTQALGKVLGSASGRMWSDRATEGEKEGRAGANQLLAQALQGGDLKDNISGMLTNPWSADQGSALAGRFLQHKLDASSPDAGLRRQQIELGNKQLQEQIAQRQQTYPLEAERLKLQVEEQRNKANDPIELMLRERLKTQTGDGQPTQPNRGRVSAGHGGREDRDDAARVPLIREGRSYPGVRLQSDPVEQQGDPNLIQAQAPGQSPVPAVGPQAPQQAQPQRDMVNLPGIGPIDVETARALAFNYARKGNAGAAKMIEEAIGSGLDKGARTELDKTRINLTNQIGRLKEIEGQFEPNFQRAGTQLDMMFKAASEKLGAPLAPQHQQELQKFHAYRSATIGHFNQMLKELSGTAVSAQEFERIKAQLPNPGTGFANGVMDGDSPAVFKGKLAQARRDVSLAAARANFMAANGFRGDKEALAAAMPLDAVPKVIEQRGQLLEQQLRQQHPQANPKDIQLRVDQQLKQEFGI